MPTRSVSPEIASVASVVSSTSSQSVSSKNASHRSVPVQVFEGHERPVFCMCFSPDENQLVGGSGDGTLLIWDRKTGAVEVLSGHTDSVYGIDVSRDEKMVVSGSDDGTVRIWDRDSRETMHVIEGHGGSVRSVEFSADSSRVMSGSIDGTIRVWSVETGELAFEPIECRHGGFVYCARYSPSGDRIASAATSVQIWDAETGNGILSIRNPNTISSLVWTVDSTHIIGDSSFDITIWNAYNGEQLRTWKVHDHIGTYVTTLSLSPTGTYLASSNWGKKTTFVFDISTGEKVKSFEHGKNSYGIAYSSSGEFIATGCIDKKVYVWEAPVIEDPQAKVSCILVAFTHC
ncbi:hypothetical protein PAXINDRAFT_82942 [Paxillus involutus ATCC 200175]|uniref:WD40 repeat-like protein n=1 Tax=Paxillus involutus ATCC 200175 TaxID=664439 RepID=A0A0C9TPD0_PAXIN|nr:hypothetical protein PAXINDRAFT_82942 [Paxillus involutus ATCC 200175]